MSNLVIFTPYRLNAHSGSSLTELLKDEYSFGRGDECDYSFELRGGKQNAHFLALSKTHFILYRVRLCCISDAICCHGTLSLTTVTRHVPAC